jgi:hypothetical protein
MEKTAAEAPNSRRATFAGSGTQEAVEAGLRCSQVDGGHDLGPAVHASALAQVVVGFAANDLFGEAWHVQVISAPNLGQSQGIRL